MASLTPLPQTAGVREFAGILKCRPSYITQLKKDDRLVLTPDRRKVLVQASLERIEETKDPSRQRQAAEQAPITPPPATEPDLEDDSQPVSYQTSRAIKERYQAAAAKRDFEISMGKLLDAATVEGLVADAVVTLRTRLESLPDILAPQLAAEKSETRCRAIAADSIEHALDECARSFKKIASGQV